MLDAIDITTPLGLRDHALIGLTVYTFARVGAAIDMRVEDVYVQVRRTWVRLHEKRGKVHELPCHHNFDEYVHAYRCINGLSEDKRAFLFRSAKGRGGQLSSLPMSQADVYRMVSRRAAAASINTKIGCHSFVPLASPSTCAMEASSKWPSKWPTMKVRARLDFMTGGKIRYRSTRSSGF